MSVVAAGTARSPSERWYLCINQCELPYRWSTRRSPTEKMDCFERRKENNDNHAGMNTLVNIKYMLKKKTEAFPPMGLAFQDKLSLKSLTFWISGRKRRRTVPSPRQSTTSINCSVTNPGITTTMNRCVFFIRDQSSKYQNSDWFASDTSKALA